MFLVTFLNLIIFLGPIEIISNLYLGNKVDASSLELLRKANISHILNVTPDLPNSFESCSGGINGVDTVYDFKYTRLAVKDDWTGDLVSRFTEAYEFIGKCFIEHLYLTLFPLHRQGKAIISGQVCFAALPRLIS